MQLAGREGLVVVLLQRLVERVLGIPGLHPHLAGGGLRRVAARSSARLHQQREQPLRRAEIAAEQRAVRIHRRHQRDAAEVVSLGDHLRAHQDVDIALVHGRELRFEAALELGGVGIDARHARPGQRLRELLLQALGPAPQRRDVRIAAGRTGPRHARRHAAMVAAQRAVLLVEDLVRAAMRAVALPVALVAMQHRRVAAAVQEHQALLAAVEPLAQRVQQRHRQRGGDALLALEPVHVEEPDARQRAAADALGQVDAPITTAQRVLPALQRRRRRAQQHRDLLQVAAIDRQVPRRVARAVLLLVGRVVLLVDHDQSEPRHRREDRQPRAQHQLRATQVRREPVPQALRRREAAVKRHDRVAGEALGETRLELRRQVDLGHQHQHLLAALQGGLGGAQVDLGLAAAGQAPEQCGRWRLASGQLQDGVERRLLLRGQRGPVSGRGRRIRCIRRVGRLRRGRRVGLVHLLQPRLQLLGVQVPQLGRQHRQRQFADAALVVARGELHQPPPAVGQRRQRIERLAHRSQLGFGQALVLGQVHAVRQVVPHQPHHVPTAQRHMHQGARGQVLRAEVVQRSCQPAVLGCLHGDPHAA